MPSTFTPNRAGIGEMLRADFIAAAMLKRAERVKAYAEAIAPYDPKDRDGRHYRDSFKARVEIKPTGRRNEPRAVGVVENDNEAALFVETGNRNTPRHATLRRALTAVRD